MRQKLFEKRDHSTGKSRAFINDTPVNLDILSRLSEVLIDVHSQSENQSLFKNEYQFLVLDADSRKSGYSQRIQK